jgi:FixJ family two-component response regulator
MDKLRPSVAIVDDDDAVLKALRRLLTAAGFEACAFHSGREFLASLAEHPVRCVLLDIQMPELDGFAVAQRLSELIDRIPVIFLSAHDSDLNRRRAEKLGGSEFLRKPASGSEILAAIRRAIDPAGTTGDEDEDGTKVP